MGLWVVTRVSDEKRQELVQSLSAFMAEASMRPCRRLILQDLNDDNLVAWLAYWRTGEELERFLGSATFRAIKGAAETLGHVEDVHRVVLHSVVEDAKPRRGEGESH